MKRYLHFYYWVAAIIMMLCSAATVLAQTKVTSLSQLKAGCVIKIYPKSSDGTSHYGDSKLALACSGNGKDLTSYEKAGAGDSWTLEAAGDGYYLKNNLGCYWAYQSKSSFGSLTCTTSESSAVKVSLTWDSKYGGVCFWNQKDNSGLNNLYGYNYRFNWFSSKSDYNSSDANTTFDVAILGEGADVEVDESPEYDCEKDLKVVYYISESEVGKEVELVYDPYNIISYSCAFLDDARIHGSFTSATFNNVGIHTLVIKNIQSLNPHMFQRNRLLREIWIPKSRGSIPANFLDGCENCTKIYSFRTDAPKVFYSNVFSNCGKNIEKGNKKLILVSSSYQNGYKNEWSELFNQGFEIAELIKVKAIRFNSVPANINTGPYPSTANLSVLPSNAEVTKLRWSSSNISVATVKQTGEIFTVSPGFATITASSIDGSNVSVSFKIEVSQTLVENLIVPNSLTLEKTKSETIKPSISPYYAFDQSLNWTTSNKDVADVTQDGVITGKSVGTATISVQTKDGSNIKKDIVVSVSQLFVSRIDIPYSLSLEKGKSSELKATVSPDNADNPKIFWSSSNPEVATVDEL